MGIKTEMEMKRGGGGGAAQLVPSRGHFGINIALSHKSQTSFNKC